MHARWSISHWNCQRIDSTIIEFALTQDAMWSRLFIVHFCTKGVVFHIQLRLIQCAHHHIRNIVHLVRCIPDHKLCMNFDDFTVFFVCFSFTLREKTLSYFFSHFCLFSHSQQCLFVSCRWLFFSVHSLWRQIRFLLVNCASIFSGIFCEFFCCNSERHLWYVEKPIEPETIPCISFLMRDMQRSQSFHNLNLFCQQFMRKLIYAVDQIIQLIAFSVNCDRYRMLNIQCLNAIVSLTERLVLQLLPFFYWKESAANTNTHTN